MYSNEQTELIHKILTGLYKDHTDNCGGRVAGRDVGGIEQKRKQEKKPSHKEIAVLDSFING